MEGSKTSHFFAFLLATLSVMISVNGQISSPCSSVMISTFTPCLNFITGSTQNGSTTPTESCCSAFKSLTTANMDCACLLITANVPIQLPINRTLSLSLPRVCNMGGVPLQCKATGAPLPAPGPAILFAPAPSLIADSPHNPGDSKAGAPAPEIDTDLAPATPPTVSNTPAGIRPVLTPPSPIASSGQSSISPRTILLFVAGIVSTILPFVSGMVSINCYF